MARRTMKPIAENAFKTKISKISGRGGFAIRLIPGGHLDPINTGGPAPTSIGSPPRPFQQSDTAQFVHCETAPSAPPILALQSAPALSAILIAKQTKLSLLVPTQNMRAQQPLTVLIAAIGCLPAIALRIKPYVSSGNWIWADRATISSKITPMLVI